DAVAVSHFVTNGPSLPRSSAFDAKSPDPDNLRAELFDPAATDREAVLSLTSRDAGSGQVRGRRDPVVARREGNAGAFRSAWYRLVGDDMDAQAPGVTERVLPVALRDTVEIAYRTPTGVLRQGIRVGRPGDEDGP